VTVAAAAVIGGALLLFASGFDALVNLQTVDQREHVASLLSSGSLRDLGLTVDELLGWMRLATLVTGAAAAGAAVLGWFALQRHRGARVALAVVGVVLMLCAPLSGGFLAGFVVVAIAMLWSAPARDWFAGRPVRERPAFTAPQPRRPQGERPEVHREVPAPAALLPWQGLPPQSAHPVAPPATAPQTSAVGPTQDRRPGGVVAACVLTWVFAGAAAALFVLAAAMMVIDPTRLTGQFVTEIQGSPQLQQAGVTPATAPTLLWLVIAFYFCWSLAACVLAWLSWRRHSWARIVLVVSAFGVAALGMVALLAGGLFAVPHVVAAVTAAGLLLGGNSNRWYARRPQLPGPHPPADRQHAQPPRPPRSW
jgi:hypothetical protein